MMYRTPPVTSNVFWATSDRHNVSFDSGRVEKGHSYAPNAMSEKKAPHQSIERKTQLKPITRPCRFQISRYGGNRPTARRTAATMPMARIGASFPLL